MRGHVFAALTGLALVACKGGGDTEETGPQETGQPGEGLEITVHAPTGLDTSNLAASAYLLGFDETTEPYWKPDRESDGARLEGAASVVLQIPPFDDADVGPVFAGYEGALWVVYLYEDLGH